jgi:hypothetical protein
MHIKDTRTKNTFKKNHKIIVFCKDSNYVFPKHILNHIPPIECHRVIKNIFFNILLVGHDWKHNLKTPDLNSFGKSYKLLFTFIN